MPSGGTFCRNARAVLEDRLAGRIWVRQDIGIDVDDDLVSLSGCAGLDAAVERVSATRASASACCWSTVGVSSEVSFLR